MADLVPADLAVLEARARLARAALNDRQAAFVAAVVSGKTLTDAAKVAGYSVNGADRYGAFLAHKPLVRAALDAERAVAAAKAGYDVATMMAELDSAIEHARKTENASAHVRAIELKGKLAGILVDRVDARVAVGGFVLNVHGLEGVGGA